MNHFDYLNEDILKGHTFIAFFGLGLQWHRLYNTYQYTTQKWFLKYFDKIMQAGITFACQTMGIGIEALRMIFFLKNRVIILPFILNS